jgi:hypothetical protein
MLRRNASTHPIESDQASRRTRIARYPLERSFVRRGVGTEWLGLLHGGLAWRAIEVSRVVQTCR